MASALFLCLGVTSWKAACTEMATSAATSPVRRRELLDDLNSRSDLRHPKTDCGFRSQSQGLLHPAGGTICSISLRTQTQIVGKKKKKKKSKGFLETRSQALVQGHGFTFSTEAPRTQALCTRPRVGTGTPAALQHGLLEIRLSHLLQLLLVSSVHTRHWLKLVSVLQKMQNRIWEEQGSKDRTKRGSAEGQNLPNAPFKGLYHRDCFISKTKHTYFLLIQ